MQQATDKPVTDDRVMAVPAGLPQTGGADRLALFFGARLDRPGRAALGYPPEYFRWLTRITGGASYLDAALIGDVNSRGATGEARIGGTGRLTGPSASRPLLGAAITRPLTLAIWSNMKLRAALRETVAENERQHSTKGWVRHLTRARDAELADALARLLPENHYSLRAAIVEFLDADPPATPLAASDSPEGDAPEDGDEGGSSSSSHADSGRNISARAPVSTRRRTRAVARVPGRKAPRRLAAWGEART